jgi:hypothetical protein
MTIVLRVLCLVIASGALTAQTSVRVEIATPEPAALAQTLEADGFDVLPGTIGRDSLQLILAPGEELLLEPYDVSFTVLERGRPYTEIAAELGELPGTDPAVPTGYLDMASIETRLDGFAAGYPGLCRVVDLTATYGMPTTFEGRSLTAVVISDNVSVSEDEPTMLIVSCHHCRELVTPVIAMTAISNLLSQYGSDPQVTAAVDSYEIWIAPVWNPDGYNEVFTADNMWRKNRRVFPEGIGVDTNRNYPFGWDATCSGSSQVTSGTYKGPSAASEPETQTMMAFSQDRRFTKVIDYHSSGQEVLWGYSCSAHPLAPWLQDEAIALSNASGYGGEERPPSAEGEHYEWQTATLGSHAFLIEAALSFQPTFAAAQSEAALVWPGILWALGQPVPLAGHVTNASTGLPLVASINLAEVSYVNGESNASHADFGRYHVFVPPGSYSASFTAPGYEPFVAPVSVSAGVSTVLDVALVPIGPTGSWADLGAALAGTSGLPVLVGSGDLTPFSITTLSLGNALPGSSAWLVLGFVDASAAFKGGTLVPSPDVLIGPFPIDAGGLLEISAPWPNGVPGALVTYLQEWIVDPAGPLGFAASNALSATTP